MLKVDNKKSVSILNNKYIIKVEQFDNYGNEYSFYKKNSKKIIKDKFNKFLQIPIKYKKDYKNKHIIYIFTMLDGDINRSFLKSIRNNDFINILDQSILSIYYLNHKLKYFHNDLYRIGSLLDINNIMYVKNNDMRSLIKIDDMTVEVKKYRVVIIDFEKSTKESGFKIDYFYIFFSNFYEYNFKYMSEIFIMCILCNPILDIKNLYIYIESRMKGLNLEDFDKSLFENRIIFY